MHDVIDSDDQAIRKISLAFLKKYYPIKQLTGVSTNELANKTIAEADPRYSAANTSSLTDSDFDMIWGYLDVQNNSKLHGDIIRNRLPLGDKITHSAPMRSIRKYYDDDKPRLLKALSKTDGGGDIYVQPKLDGIAIAISYRKGHLVSASTRGNGNIGENVTHTVSVIHGIPHVIDVLYPIDVFGEIVISKSKFDYINKDLAKRGEDPLSTQRNTAAGAICRLKPNRITCVLSGVFYGMNRVLENDSYSRKLRDLIHLGFTTPPYQAGVLSPTYIDDSILTFRSNMRRYQYPIDGLVFHTDMEHPPSSQYQEGVFAFKLNNESAITTVTSIDLNIGGSGYITPMANVNPINLEGVVIKRVTLHSMSILAELGIGIGSTVKVELAGKIIPRISQCLGSPIGVFKIAQNACPSCKSKLLISKEGKSVQCVNTMCPAVLSYRLHMSCRPKAFNVEGLSIVTAAALVESCGVTSIIDLMSLNLCDLLRIYRFGKTRAEKLLKAIVRARRNLPFSDFIRSLLLPGVGESGSTILAQNIKDKGVVVTRDNLIPLLLSKELSPTFAKYANREAFVHANETDLLEYFSSVDIDYSS